MEDKMPLDEEEIGYWWEFIKEYDVKWFTFNHIILVVGLLDLSLLIFRINPILHWANDALLIFGSIGMHWVQFVSLRERAKRYNNKVELETLSESTLWYLNMHWRHKVRFWIAFFAMFIGLFDFALNIFRAGMFSWTADGVLIISGFGLLGTATYLAIDAYKSEHDKG